MTFFFAFFWGISIDIIESLVVALATMEHYKRVKMGVSASRMAKRKSVAQQNDNSAPPFKKMKTNRHFLPYEEAKKVVNALGLKSERDWPRWSRTERPPEIPGCPWSLDASTLCECLIPLGVTEKPVIFSSSIATFLM